MTCKDCMKWKKVKPKYCPRSGRRLRFYWCHNCRLFHWPFRILVEVVK